MVLEEGVLPHAQASAVEGHVANIIVDILENGDLAFNVKGLKEEPVFVRHGRDIPGDPTQNETAKVLLEDDESFRGVPQVLIKDCYTTDHREDWGDDEWIYPTVVVLDCNANEFEGAITTGVSALGSDRILAGACAAILSDERVMAKRGFGNPTVRSGASVIEPGREYHHPITLTMDVYVRRN